MDLQWPSTDGLRICDFFTNGPLSPWSWEWDPLRDLNASSIDIAPAMDENISMSLPPVYAGPSVDDVSLAPHVHDFPFRARDEFQFYLSNNGRSCWNTLRAGERSRIFVRVYLCNQRWLSVALSLLNARRLHV